MIRLFALLFWLTFMSGVACGFYLDRWLHRPISTVDFTVPYPGQVSNRPEGQAPTPCYTDKPEECKDDPGPLNESPRGVNVKPEDRPKERPIRPISMPCFFDPLHNATCQQAT